MAPSHYSSAPGWVMITTDADSWDTSCSHRSLCRGICFPQVHVSCLMGCSVSKKHLLPKEFGRGVPVWPSAHFQNHHQLAPRPLEKGPCSPDCCPFLFSLLETRKDPNSNLSSATKSSQGTSDKLTWQFRSPWADHLTFLSPSDVNQG